MRFIASFVFVIGLFISLPLVTQAVSFTTNDFITTWDTENTGTSASNQITIPGTGSGYSYSIYWESLSSTTATGTIATSTSASQTITFPEPGEYKVAIKGTYPRIYFNNSGDKLKILTVEQWGSPDWTSMASAFYGCANLTVPATDAPNLSGVTTLSAMFRGASSFNNSINHWDVSGVLNLQSMFLDAAIFNQPLNLWNTTNVTNIGSLFQGATSFNQSLNSWDVSKVTNMASLFAFASMFNQSLNSWDVSSVTNMNNLFQNTIFNQPLNSWDVTNVVSMQAMFLNSSFFNQSLSSWNTASATTMRKMFYDATSFDQDLSNWNIENITPDLGSPGSINDGLYYMFYNAGLSQPNQDATLVGWAAQSLKSSVPFHLGLKTYSSTGATALNTLRNTYNWTITEQYQASYEAGDDYTLSGTTTQSPITSGSSTTAVEVIPDNRCTFIDWSDGNTTNPRIDTLTDNLTVSANVECHNPVTGSGATTRYEKLLEFGNTTEAEAVKNKYLNTTPTNPATQTLETAIINIKTLTTNPAITNNSESRQQLISILQQLVQILRGMAGESNK